MIEDDTNMFFHILYHSIKTKKCIIISYFKKNLIITSSALQSQILNCPIAESGYPRNLVTEEL